MKKLLIVLGVVILAIVIVVLIKKNKNTEVDNFAIGEAVVSSVSIAFQESFPLGVQVEVEGDLPDSCTELGDVIQTRNEKTGDFIVTLQTKKPLDAVCAQVLSAFDTSFVLEGTDGLPKGDYTVIVNGVKESFTFEVDNFISNVDTLK
jgi:hypothetical protein